MLNLAPAVVAVADEQAVDSLAEAIKTIAEHRGVPRQLPKIVHGQSGIEEVAAWPADVVLNGVTGALNLSSTLAALNAGSTLALANKESLIVGGPVVMHSAEPGQIVPVDSEHAALAQALRGGTSEEVAKLLLTATGGPFRDRTRAQLAGVTPEQALAHPAWSMGPVISINSATLVNKGLEVIEAHLLFDTPLDSIDVVVHPQAVTHSMVEFVDGATLAQASPPDMRLPIALGLSWPDRLPGATTCIYWSQAHTWELSPLDEEAFPSVALAREVGRTSGSPCRLQGGERGVRGRIPQGTAAVPRNRRYGRRRGGRAQRRERPDPGRDPRRGRLGTNASCGTGTAMGAVSVMARITTYLPDEARGWPDHLYAVRRDGLAPGNGRILG